MKRNGKKTLIASIISLSLVLTGIGYAYWTDTLNVTTKAATGEMDVTFVDLGLYAQYGNEATGLPGPNPGWSIVDGIGNPGYVDDMFFARGTSNYNIIAPQAKLDAYADRAEDWNNIEFDAELVDAAPIEKAVGDYTIAKTNGSDNILLDIKNFYPGYAQAFRTDIINQGTMAAKLSNIKFNVGILDNHALTNETKDMLGVAILVDQDNIGIGNTTDNTFKLCTAFASGDNFFTIGGIDFLRLSALESLTDAQVKAVIKNAEILSVTDNSSRMDLVIGVAMDPDADGVYTSGSTNNPGYVEDTAQDALSENKGVKVSIDFAWDQFNEGNTDGNGNILYKQNAPE